MKKTAVAKSVAVQPKVVVQPKNARQHKYLQSTLTSDVVFGIGPAGTGKTYLAVAMAVRAIITKRVKRIVLTRPVVEAGEKLGFLPGTLEEKINPYLRPLYDALYDILGDPMRVARMMEKKQIEIAPLAFMRGRTIKDSFIVLDEAQNTTCEQMHMMLTRIGESSQIVVTGDPTQSDLGKNTMNGLMEAVNVLDGVEGIDFHYFNHTDVVRHEIVKRIVLAYEQKSTQLPSRRITDVLTPLTPRSN